MTQEKFYHKDEFTQKPTKIGRGRDHWECYGVMITKEKSKYIFSYNGKTYKAASLKAAALAIKELVNS